MGDSMLVQSTGGKRVVLRSVSSNGYAIVARWMAARLVSADTWRAGPLLASRIGVWDIFWFIPSCVAKSGCESLRTGMRIWPAIDLRGGKCVRLRQGDYGRETVFGEDPAAMARHWASQGAECLHLVDLDGARSGQVENWSSIEAIVKAVPGPCELGGGVRDETTIQRLFDLGLDRVVIGTLALKQPDWFRLMCRKFPG
jgi:uncharacterized protein related to proFAR isomerase